MKKFIFILSAVLLFGGCSPCKNLTASQQEQQDSARVETRKEVVYVPDTLYVEIPVQTAERTTRDSTSHLENDYATSDARINTDGTLFHDLNTKPQKKPVAFDKPVERQDSIVYQYKYKYITEIVKEEVERELTWWQKTQIYGFWVALIVILIAYRKDLLAIAKRIIS